MNPNVSVVKDYYTDDLDARVASGVIGDVFEMPCDLVYKYAIEDKVLEPLDRYLNSFGIDASPVISAVYNLGVVDGRLYMVARDYNQLVLMVNKDALKHEGLDLPGDNWDWETFKREYAPKLTKVSNGGVYTQIPMNLDLGDDLVYISFMEGWGGKWYDEVSKSLKLVSDPKVFQGICEMIFAAQEGLLYPSYKTDTSVYDGLSDTDYVFRQLVYPELEKLAKEYQTKGIEWDIATFPSFPIKKVGTYSPGFGVHIKTKNTDAAAAFALFLYTDWGQKNLHINAGGAPVLGYLANNDFWHKHEYNGKNLDAFAACPEHSIVGRLGCLLPTSVAEVIGGDVWKTMLKNHFDGVRDIEDSLREMEKTASEKWKSL